MDNYTRIKKIRQQNICLFKDYSFNCEENGKTAKNHLISKANYLKRISNQDRVLVFDFENRDYSKRNRELTERNIKKANTFNIFCSKHDDYLFNEIENGNKFDETNKKQLFQFAFRALVFSYSEQDLKDNFDKIVTNSLNKIGEAHLHNTEKIFKKYRFLIEINNWDGVETEIIKLNKKCEFISCWSGNLNIGINGLFRLSPSKISINIFPNENETVILLSYLKDDVFFADKLFCQRLKKLATTNEKKFITYIEKLAVAFDHNIALSPVYWSKCDEISKSSFYEIAHIFPKVKNLKDGLLGILKLKKLKLKLNLIH